MATEENKEYIVVNLTSEWYEHFMSEVTEAIESQANEIEKAAQATEVDTEYIQVLKDNYSIFMRLKSNFGNQSAEEPIKIYAQDYKDLFWMFMWNTSNYRDQIQRLKTDLEASFEQFNELKELSDNLVSNTATMKSVNKELVDTNKNLVSILKKKAQGQEPCK